MSRKVMSGETPHASHRSEIAECGICGRRWCGFCDPAPAALCHWCHGRGYSIAPISAASRLLSRKNSGASQ